jgi:meiotically up-regulated gene 157 (Mug157) protein
VFQLDQQCYPFLELCDFFDAFPEDITFVETVLQEKSVLEVVELVESKRDRVTGLFPTDETPGDDAVEYPFHFSSHILLWYTLSRLSGLEKLIRVNSTSHALDLSSFAEDIKHSTISHFTSANPRTGKSMFAYLVDGAGKATFYHDANDVPTLFAPVWNFVQSKPDLELWRNTMEFGLSPLNEKGYCVGEPFGGLGSVHTSGPWPLGYFQEFVFAQMIGDEAAEKDAWRRIRGAMLWDGLFSEAVDYRSAECTSKAWFSWPGSMIGSALLRSDQGRNYLEF